MGFTLEHIHRTINNLGRLMPAKPNKDSNREYSLKDCIFLMAPKLLEKREMGCTTNELVKALLDEEIDIKAATLNRYLHEYQKLHEEEQDIKPKEKAEGSAKERKPVADYSVEQSAESPKPLFGQSAKRGQDVAAPI